MEFPVKSYVYKKRICNLHAEAVGVVKGKKYFPVFEGNMIFKPLTKSKPFSNPLFAYAEVFWSKVINAYFMPAPEYELAICEGYEVEEEKYFDYGTVVPRIYNDGEHLVNLLEYFRAHPDDKVNIDNYVNYCQMFYDYTDILESVYFQTHTDMAEQLAMHLLVSILKGDQNYHYENVAFICDASDRIVRLAPMIDHEFSAYFMFPDVLRRNFYWYEELKRSIVGGAVKPGEYDDRMSASEEGGCLHTPDERRMAITSYARDITNAVERELYKKSAVSLHKNIVYIKNRYPRVMAEFVEKLCRFERELNDGEEQFFLKKNSAYPDMANSDAFLIGKARYKDKDEEKAQLYEKKYGGKGSEIDFDLINKIAIKEIKGVIQQIKNFA